MTICIKKGNREYVFYATDFYTEHSYKPEKYWLHICGKKFKVTVNAYDYLTLVRSYATEKTLYINLDDDYCEFKDRIK